MGDPETIKKFLTSILSDLTCNCSIKDINAELLSENVITFEEYEDIRKSDNPGQCLYGYLHKYRSHKKLESLSIILKRDQHNHRNQQLGRNIEEYLKNPEGP